MSMIKKLLTIVKGSANEMGEAIIDKQQLRLMRQKMRETETHLAKGETALTEVMVDRENCQKDITKMREKIDQYGDYIRACLEKKESDLANEIAQKIAEIEGELNVRTAHLEGLTKAEERLKEQRKKTSDRLNAIKRDLSLITAQESFVKAIKQTKELLGERIDNSGETITLADEIAQKQQREMDLMNASELLQAKEAGQDLDNKLVMAGVILDNQHQINEILSRYSNPKE